MAILRVAGGQPELIEWAKEQGLDPEDYSTQIDLHVDGRVTLYKFRRDLEGKRYAVGNEMATESVTITPTRPIPELFVD